MLCLNCIIFWIWLFGSIKRRKFELEQKHGMDLILNCTFVAFVFSDLQFKKNTHKNMLVPSSFFNFLSSQQWMLENASEGT